MKRLLNIAKFCTFCLFCLLPMIAFGQTQGYKTGYTWSTTDITVQATSGTNAWKYIAGNPVCNPSSLAIGSGDMSLWCVGIGTNTPPYEFDPVHRVWVAKSAMGGSVLALIIQNAENIFSMQRVAHCGVWAGVQFYGLFHWTGTAWVEPNNTACATNYTIGADGVLAAAGWDSNSNVRALFTSPDSGVTWNLWSDDWIYVNMQNSAQGCAINSSDVVYRVAINTDSTALSSIPSGTPVGCVNSPGAFIVWNNAAQAFLLKSDVSGWLTISNTQAQQIVALSKAYIFALDNSGKAYHWNVYAPSITATITGTFDNFPMGGLNPRPKHTSHIKVTFPQGINTAPASTETIDFAGAMNNSYSDIAPLCDPYYGSGSNDPGCVPNIDSNDAECSVAGPINPANPPEPVGQQESMDVRDYVYDKDDYGPTLLPSLPESAWSGQVLILTSNGCVASLPTCPMTARTDYITDYWIAEFITGDTAGSASAWAAVLNGMAASRNGKTAPWLYPVPYEVNSDGTPACEYPPDIPGSTIATWHQLDIPPCQ